MDSNILKEMRQSLDFKIEIKKVKRCNTCKMLKPVRYFFKKGQGRVSPNCKKCDVERIRKYKKSDKYRAQHALQARKRNQTEEGKALLKKRNRRAYLKRKKKQLDYLLAKIK